MGQKRKVSISGLEEPMEKREKPIPGAGTMEPIYFSSFIPRPPFTQFPVLSVRPPAAALTVGESVWWLVIIRFVLGENRDKRNRRWPAPGIQSVRADAHNALRPPFFRPCYPALLIFSLSL